MPHICTVGIMCLFIRAPDNKNFDLFSFISPSTLENNTAEGYKTKYFSVVDFQPQ